MIDPRDIELVKRQLEAQLDEYERAIQEAAAFAANWRARQGPTPPATPQAQAVG
jgi:hypothetical protein